MSTLSKAYWYSLFQWKWVSCFTNKPKEARVSMKIGTKWHIKHFGQKTFQLFPRSRGNMSKIALALDELMFMSFKYIKHFFHPWSNSLSFPISPLTFPHVIFFFFFKFKFLSSLSIRDLNKCMLSHLPFSTLNSLHQFSRFKPFSFPPQS